MSWSHILGFKELAADGAVTGPNESHLSFYLARRALNLHDKLFHQPQLCPGIFPEMLFCKGPQFVSAGSWSLDP